MARFILQDLPTAPLPIYRRTPPGGKNRISRDVAYLLRSRGSFRRLGLNITKERPSFLVDLAGRNAASISDFNIDNEISYFLGEAMSSSKVVADKLVDNLLKNADTAEGAGPTVLLPAILTSQCSAMPTWNLIA